MLRLARGRWGASWLGKGWPEIQRQIHSEQRATITRRGQCQKRSWKNSQQNKDLSLDQSNFTATCCLLDGAQGTHDGLALDLGPGPVLVHVHVHG